MLTGELRGKVDRVWDAFWSSGIANPLEVMEEQTAIPGIAARAAMIEEIQTEVWWEGVTVLLLELVQHIEKGHNAVVYADCTDEVGEETTYDLPEVGEVGLARFEQKGCAFLKAHEGHITLHKLRQGKPLTRAFIGDGAATAEQIEFIGLVVDHLTDRGVMEPGLLYESPFTDVAPQGPDEVFDAPRTDQLIRLIRASNRVEAA